MEQKYLAGLGAKMGTFIVLSKMGQEEAAISLRKDIHNEVDKFLDDLLEQTNEVQGLNSIEPIKEQVVAVKSNGKDNKEIIHAS